MVPATGFATLGDVVEAIGAEWGLRRHGRDPADQEEGASWALTGLKDLLKSLHLPSWLGVDVVSDRRARERRMTPARNFVP